jgi:hypothetical protein
MEVIKMTKKLIILVVLAVCFTFAFLGCSDNQGTKNVKGNSLEKSTILTPAPISANAASQKAELVKVTVKGRNDSENVFDKPDDIKVFTTAIETGTPIKSVPSNLKAPPYFVYFHYSDNQKVEYFLYISQSNGWIYKNGTREAYTLSKGSVEDLNHLLLQFTEDEAIAKVIKDHPEFPDKAGMKESKGNFGGKEVKEVTIKFETKVDRKSNNSYTVDFIKTWEIKINGKKPESYWKYDVSPQKVTLVEENKSGEWVNIIK